jgi:polar amino acid transport system substrate-binding protein
MGGPAGYARRVRALLLLAVLALGGCQYPRDPDGTLDRVRGGILVAGWTVNDPWVAGEGDGLEPDLVRQLARQLDADVVWGEMSEEEQLEALERKTIDIGIGGYTNDSLLKRKVSLTRSFVSTHLEVATPAGRDLADDLAGARVAVEAHSAGEGRLRQATKAIVLPVESIADAPADADAIAAWDYELDDLRLRPTNKELVKERHVWALPPGENAWQVEVEGFLLDRGEEISQALREEGPS